MMPDPPLKLRSNVAAMLPLRRKRLSLFFVPLNDRRDGWRTSTLSDDGYGAGSWRSARTAARNSVTVSMVAAMSSGLRHALWMAATTCSPGLM